MSTSATMSHRRFPHWFAGILILFSFANQGMALDNIKSVKITNTRADWFYIEELELLNGNGTDVASTVFGTTATSNNGAGFGSSLNGPIDDLLGAGCCGNGWHSSDNVSVQVYTITFPSVQTITGMGTMWNRQDGCCPERMDGMLFEFFGGDDGGGALIGTVQVDGLGIDAADQDGASFVIGPPPEDTDGDGLPDIWEVANGLDPNDNGENPNNNGVAGDPNNGFGGDPDMDTLTNGEEFALRTNPQLSDSDSDGLDDNVETNDGIFVDLNATGTDPLDDDTDDDGLLDGVESKTGTYVDETDTGTDPHLADSDGDTLLDGVENPSLPHDPLNPATQPGTDPNKADTDGDTVGDGFEVQVGSDPTDINSVPPPQPAGIVNGVRSVRITNTRPDWFYIEEVEILNTLDADVASVVFGSTAFANTAPGFGSTVNGGIDDVIGNCCGTGTHSSDNTTVHEYIITFPDLQNLHRDITMWNRQDACCPERLDGMLFDFFSGPDGTGDLLASQQVDNLAADSGGGISTATGASFSIAGPIGPAVLDLDVTLDTDELIFSWGSAGGRLYNLRSPVDPSAPDPDPLLWPIFDGHENMAATPPMNVLAIALPADPQRLFIVEEFNAPPVSIFFEDFESGQGTWTVGGSPGEDPGTAWELGTPSSVGPPAAFSGSSAFGTNIADNYTLNADVFLRSPIVDLTTAGGATLNFAQWVDVEAGFDTGSVVVLDATDNSELASIADVIDGDFPFDWDLFSMPVPAIALGKNVIFEFRLLEDGFVSGPQAGWYIDDVNVTIP